jgi:predicted small lipoprotein YifL
MNTLRPTAVLLLLCLLLAGCGQKGRLYLPEEPSQPPAGSASG